MFGDFTRSNLPIWPGPAFGHLHHGRLPAPAAHANAAHGFHGSGSNGAADAGTTGGAGGSCQGLGLGAGGWRVGEMINFVCLT